MGREKKDNSGVCVQGDAGEGESDWYGVIKEILELEYVGEPMKTIVLFNCEWYNPTRSSRTLKHNHYKVTKVNHTKRYGRYDTFIIAHNARLVYYLPYLGNYKSNWRVVIKTKARDQSR